MRYPPPQLRLLILLGLILLVGLGVREWRAGFPDAAERLERFDRDDDAAILPEPVAARPAPVLRAPRDTSTTGPVAAPRTESGADASPGGRVVRALPPPASSSPPARSALGASAVLSPPAEPLDVNRADVPALARLPGVSPALAQRIVEERKRRGRFESPEALRYVLGMGPKKLAAIRPFITVRD